MEQAVNTFTKGLQSDTHPMVQGNDTLSDALNATFITMNGNEVVLQNDMGNRRVDNAFLPAGYEPVGIKEYGGIIYVAAYNPITNRSQIGSFPSPERKGEGGSESLSIDFSNQFIDSSNNKLKTKEIIIKITENSLRAGDKFSIYKINNNDDILQNIINLFELNVGILNSQNEFLDITDDLQKFNDSFIEKIENNEESGKFPTTNDQNFMQNRLALPINTYSYKLVSPLYLKVKINTFNTVVWNIEGDKDNGNITLYPTATYIFEDGFNIPDDFPASIKIGDENIKLEKQESRLIDSNTVIVTYKSIEFIKGESDYIYYDNENNELSFSFKNNIIEYNIYSYLFHNGFYGNEEIIVDETSGSKDISKLNSDTIEFNGWRYYNNDNGITEGTLDINIYAKHNNSKLESFGAKFKLNNDETTVINIVLINFSDKTNRFEFNRNDNFISRTLYNVEFYYKRDGVEITLDNQSSLFITTALFNKSYLGTEDFVYDQKYLILEGNNNLQEGSKIQDQSIITRINYSYHQHQNVYIQDFCKIKQILIYPIVQWDYSNSQNIITSSENDIFNDTESHITYNDEVTNTTEINPHFQVENSELYPYINIEYGTINKNFNSQIKTYDGKTLDEINDSLVEYTGVDSDLVHNKTITENSKTIDESTGITIIQRYKIENIAKGPSVNKTITLNNVMTSFYNFASRNSLIGTTKPYFCIDNESNKFYDISVVSDEDSTYGEHNAKKLIGNMENGNKYRYSTNSQLISDYIISHGNNSSLFASELNTDDIIMVDSESFPVQTTDNSLGRIRTLVHYKRVWIRINSETFIPFIVSGIESDEDTLDFNNVYTLLNNECKKIPHIYVYELGNESFNTKVLDINQSYKTKEFNISIKNKFKYKIESESLTTINITNGNNNYNIPNNYNDGFLGVDTDSYNEKEDEYQERNLISNQDFQDFIELLSTYHFDTGYKYGDNYNKYILFDNEGKLLDSKYVYKEIEEGVIQKIYIPSTKFTISNNMYLPNLTYDGTLTNNESDRTYRYIVSTTVIGNDGNPTQESAMYNYVTTKKDAIVMVQREENQHISLVFDKIPDIYHIGDQ